jgi:hypothetical protein
VALHLDDSSRWNEYDSDTEDDVGSGEEEEEEDDDDEDDEDEEDDDDLTGRMFYNSDSSDDEDEDGYLDLESVRKNKKNNEDVVIDQNGGVWNIEYVRNHLVSKRNARENSPCQNGCERDVLGVRVSGCVKIIINITIQ